jgi:hypothetical protein
MALLHSLRSLCFTLLLPTLSAESADPIAIQYEHGKLTINGTTLTAKESVDTILHILVKDPHPRVSNPGSTEEYQVLDDLGISVTRYGSYKQTLLLVIALKESTKSDYRGHHAFTGKLSINKSSVDISNLPKWALDQKWTESELPNGRKTLETIEGTWSMDLDYWDKDYRTLSIQFHDADLIDRVRNGS